MPPHMAALIRPNDGHQIDCALCQEDLSEETMLYVTERTFQDCFCLEDASKGIPKFLRKHILDFYGRSCFACGTALNAATLSIVHIIPRSKGGDDRPTNFQALCVSCNTERKKDADAKTAHIFLDFLTRPASSDAYDGLIW